MEENKEKNQNRKPHPNAQGGNNNNKDRRNNNHAGDRPKNENNAERQPKGENGGNNNNHNRKKRYYNKHKKKPHTDKDQLRNEQNGEPSQNEKIGIDEAVSLNAPEPEEVPASLAQPEEKMPEEVIEPEEPKPEKSSVMVQVVGIRFKSSGKTYYFDPAGISARKGEYAIVETARGLEYGEVAMANTEVSESDIVPPLRPVVRIATEADKAHNADNKRKEDEAFVLCNERILAHKLDMKLIDAQYTFDNTKLLFYFTSAGRVDFRELVKDLASVFRTRIELRQIGIRDEAKLIGGLGMCGRPLCCSAFLTDFGQVSIKMAKEQNLSLNSAKISGICGRLMCCLRYEHETYEYEIKKTPPVDSTVKTPDGIGTVTEINPLQGTIKVRLADKPDTQPRSYHRDNVTVISK